MKRNVFGSRSTVKGEGQHAQSVSRTYNTRTAWCEARVDKGVSASTETGKKIAVGFFRSVFSVSILPPPPLSQSPLHRLGTSTNRSHQKACSPHLLTGAMKIPKLLLLFKISKYDEDQDAPITNAGVSLLFLAGIGAIRQDAPITNAGVSLFFLAGIGAIIFLYSSETLRCSMVANQVGCQAMTTAADCDNLLTATCSSKCNQAPYTYCADFQYTVKFFGDCTYAPSFSTL